MTKVKISASSKSRRVRTGSGKARKVTINAKDLERKFKEQAGLCYWTGIPIDINLIFTSDYNKLAPSVDRIDSDKDYHYDNVCITFRFINYGIGSCSPKKARHYIKVITGNYKVTNNNKQQGDNMNIIDQIIAKGFDIGTPDAARFLRVFVETNGEYKAPKAKASGKNLTKGQKAYLKGKERADKNFEEIKAKELILIDSSTPDTDMVPLLDKIKEFGYANINSSDHITILGGRVGQALANGVKLGCITDTPSFHKRSDLLKELYVPNDMPNPKGA
jgi:hypothetical protein